MPDFGKWRHCLGLTGLVLLVITLDVVADDQPIQLEDIIVTSQRREQLQQDVPLTDNHYDQQFIQTIGVQSLADIDNYTPAFEVDDASVTQPTFKLRGIGTTDFGIGTDPAVGVYMDDVYIGRSGNALLQLTDIERIEVLKGPQGMLFGRNSAAGAIRIIANKPVNASEGRLRARIGNFGKHLFEGMFNQVLIPDRLMLRINALYNSRDGFIDNALGDTRLSDEHYQAGRLSLRWQPDYSTTVDYTLDLNHVDQQGPVAIGLNPTLSANRGEVFAPVANDVLKSQEKRFLHGHRLKLEHDFSWGTLNWIAAYREFDTRNREDEDGTGKTYAYLDSENREHNQQYSQELRLSGGNETLSWVTGFHYYRENGEQWLDLTTYTDSLNASFQNSLPLPPQADLPFPDGLIWTETIQNRLLAESFAVFADLSWSLTDKLEVNTGLRYTHDEKSFSWLNLPNNLFGAEFDQLFASSAYPLFLKGKWLERNKSWCDLSPRLVASYHWHDDLMTFFSYSEGYKAGGFSSIALLSEFSPESVRHYEVGFKSDWLMHRLRANAALFYYEYHDKQELSFEQLGNLGGFVTRSGDAEGKGFELDLQWLALPHLQLGARYAYLDARWLKRILNVNDFNTMQSETVNLAGMALSTPRHHAVVSLDYDLSLQRYGNLYFHFDHNYTSRRQFNRADADYYFDYPTRDDSRHFSNARLSWRDTGKQWEIALWGENIFNNHYATTVVPFSAIALGTPYVRREKPRLWGIELVVRF